MDVLRLETLESYRMLDFIISNYSNAINGSIENHFKDDDFDIRFSGDVKYGYKSGINVNLKKFDELLIKVELDFNIRIPTLNIYKFFVFYVGRLTVMPDEMENIDVILSQYCQKVYMELLMIGIFGKGICNIEDLVRGIAPLGIDKNDEFFNENVKGLLKDKKDKSKKGD